MKQKEKLEKLAKIARLYYIEDKKQSDIAKEIGVSRPLISRLLSDARELGIVEITIHNPEEKLRILLSELGRDSTIKDGVFVLDGTEHIKTNEAITESVLELLTKINSKKLAIGWGTCIGNVANYLTRTPMLQSAVKNICPLIGNSNLQFKAFQSNENVRLIAQGLGANPYYLYMPALAESYEEKELLCNTKLYRKIQEQWRNADTALVNIRNFPETPDFASSARYGSRLQKEKVVGSLLNYFYNENGDIIHNEHDFAIQIPLDVLKLRKSVVGVCAANVNLAAFTGAVRSGLFTHMVAREKLVREYNRSKELKALSKS